MSANSILKTSDLLENAGFSHGFFLRRGGASAGAFASLNFSAACGDSQKNVRQNLAIAGQELGVRGDKIFFLSQVHGTECVTIDGDETQSQVFAKEGDIVLTRRANVAAGIRTADCVPLLLGCPETGWVGACHAGWQGCERGVVPRAVDALRTAGAGRLLAAIGPHISVQSFEVGEDVAARLVGASPDKDIVDRSWPKPHVNLRKMVRSQLEASGVSTADIDDVEGCTMLEADDFFSYRRDGNPSGRMLSAIVGRGAA